MGNKNSRIATEIINHQSYSITVRIAQNLSVSHQNADRVARENASVQSKKPRVDRRDRAVPGRHRRSRFRADCRVHRVNDIETDF
jgi:hypothetical protein